MVNTLTGCSDSLSVSLTYCYQIQQTMPTGFFLSFGPATGDIAACHQLQCRQPTSGYLPTDLYLKSSEPSGFLVASCYFTFFSHCRSDFQLWSNLFESKISCLPKSQQMSNQFVLYVFCEVRSHKKNYCTSVFVFVNHFLAISFKIVLVSFGNISL